jgi:hypothetical protein
MEEPLAARIVGLRIEIPDNPTILVGAALLFAGVLFLKLTENELVRDPENINIPGSCPASGHM